MAHSDLVQSVVRAADLLDAVTDAEDGLALREISSRLGVRSPTAHNLARTLVACGLLGKSGSPPRYHPGPGLLGLAAKASRGMLLGRAEGQVVGLRERFPRATVVFVEPLGGDIGIRLRMSPERPNVLQRPREGGMHPYGTASALVFQAFWTADERAEFRQRNPFWRLGAHLWKTERAFERALDATREKGFAVVAFPEKTVCPVAAPVFGPGGELVAAIGASQPVDARSRKELHALKKAVVQAAKRLSDWSHPQEE